MGVSLELKYIVGVIVVFGYWLWSTLKKLYRRANGRNERIPEVHLLRKITPLVTSEGGWKVKTVHNGIPIWSYGTTFTFAPNNLVATATEIKAKPQEILNQLTRPELLATIFPDFPAFQSCKSQSDGDVLELTEDMYTILSIPSILLALKQMEYTFTRTWMCKPESCWMCVYPTVEVLASYYGHWFCFLIQNMDYGNSIVHILSSFPSNFTTNIINQRMTSCQVLLQMHMKSSTRPKPYVKLVPDDPALKKKSLATDENLLLEQRRDTADTSSISSDTSLTTSLPETREERKLTYTVLEKGESRIESEKVSAKISAPMTTLDSYPKLQPYLTMIKDGFDNLMSIWEADEKTEGWVLFNNADGVVVHKKAMTSGSGHDIYKGKTSIKVPLPYLIQYLSDMQYKTEYDNMFEYGNILEDLDNSLTSIIQLVYKNLFIVTGRDFVSISASRHIKDNLYGTMVRATPHASCPPIKTKVRGEVIIGGYVFTEVSKKPPVTEVMYAVCSDMNGSIPQKVVNKVSSDQPLSLAIVRRKVEERFKKRDPANDGEEFFAKLREVPSMYPNSNTDTEPSKELPQVIDMTESSETIVSDESDENNCSNEYELKMRRNKHRSASTIIPVEEEDILSEGDIIGVDEDDEHMPESDELPHLTTETFTQEGEIDFERLAQQCLAGVEEELSSAKTVETNMKINYTGNDLWTYTGVQKDVTLMKKVGPQQKVYSFLGRGIIDAPPASLWKWIKEPAMRQLYDSMLKTYDILQELDDQRKIVYLRYETHACLLKQARDFCVMTVESVNKQRYAHTACSVEIPACPVKKDCVRGRIYSSGWIVEPHVENGKDVSVVTYITQVDFGGMLPKRLMNFISKRQPLTIAYLRNHVENRVKKSSSVSRMSSSTSTVSS